jgi:hypothetical protein
MPLYEVKVDGRVRLIEAHSPQGAKAFAIATITNQMTVERASHARVHELARQSVAIEGKDHMPVIDGSEEENPFA